MTDRSLFEKLGNAVLRAKYPALKNLIASGVNTKGETIKDPIDAFAYNNTDHFIHIAYTTNDTNLRTKWLSELPGKEGDLIVGLKKAVLRELKFPKIKTIIFLVTNQHVSSTLGEQVFSRAAQDNIEINIVENSTIADFLDYDPVGQFIRQEFFKDDARILSHSLLKQILTSNILHYKNENFIDEQRIVETSCITSVKSQLDNSVNKLSLLLADSGTGKSATCVHLINKAAQVGQFVLRISPNVAGESFRLYDAIEKQLINEYPKLYLADGEIQTLLETMQWFIVIDDINRCSDPEKILARIISWAKDDIAQLQVKIICPLWPKNFSMLQAAYGKQSYFNVISLERLSREDGWTMVSRYLSENSLKLSDLDIQSVLNDTQQDPLLLSLYLNLLVNEKSYNPNLADKIIEQFILENISKLANQTGRTVLSLKMALQKLGMEMLKRRCMNPQWQLVQDWFGGFEGSVLIEYIANQGTLLSINFDDSIVFRHDRLRDAILDTSLKVLIKDISSNIEILEDPYYADLIGKSVANSIISGDEIELLLNINPLAVYCSLKYLQSDASKQYFEVIEKGISLWISRFNGLIQGAEIVDVIAFEFLRFSTRNIMHLTAGLPGSIALHLARFKNGDTVSGIKYFASHQNFYVGHGNYWLEIVLDYIKINHSTVIKQGMINLLSANLTNIGRQNAYLLAGYLQDPELTEYLQRQWRKAPNPGDLLNYLWAVLNCFDLEQTEILVEALEFSTRLAQDLNENKQKTAEVKSEIEFELGLIKWHFGDEKIEYLTTLAMGDKYDELLFQVISQIDHPLAIEVAIRKLAKLNEHLRFHPKIESWDFDTNKYRLSLASRNFLCRHWQDNNRPLGERYVALRFWLGNEERQQILEQINNINSMEEKLYETSLKWRALIGDFSVAVEFFKLAYKKDWITRYVIFIWNDNTEVLFRKWFEEKVINGSEECVATALHVLQCIDLPIAEKILIDYWSHIRLMKGGIITALFIATTESIHLATQEIHRLSDGNEKTIKRLIKQRSRFSIYKQEKPISEIKLMNATHLVKEFELSLFYSGFLFSKNTRKVTLKEWSTLVPFLHLINYRDRIRIAQECQQAGYLDLIKQHLLPSFIPGDCARFCPTDTDLHAQLNGFLFRFQENEFEEFVSYLAKRGVERTRFIKCLSAFVSRNRTLKGFELLCKCLDYLGERKNLYLVKQYQFNTKVEEHKIAALKRDIIFKVSRNSLN